MAVCEMCNSLRPQQQQQQQQQQPKNHSYENDHAAQDISGDGEYGSSSSGSRFSDFNSGDYNNSHYNSTSGQQSNGRGGRGGAVTASEETERVGYEDFLAERQRDADREVEGGSGRQRSSGGRYASRNVAAVPRLGSGVGA